MAAPPAGETTSLLASPSSEFPHATPVRRSGATVVFATLSIMMGPTVPVMPFVVRQAGIGATAVAALVVAPILWLSCVLVLRLGAALSPHRCDVSEVLAKSLPPHRGWRIACTAASASIFVGGLMLLHAYVVDSVLSLAGYATSPAAAASPSVSSVGEGTEAAPWLRPVVTAVVAALVLLVGALRRLDPLIRLSGYALVFVSVLLGFIGAKGVLQIAHAAHGGAICPHRTGPVLATPLPQGVTGAGPCAWLVSTLALSYYVHAFVLELVQGCPDGDDNNDAGDVAAGIGGGDSVRMHGDSEETPVAYCGRRALYLGVAFGLATVGYVAPAAVAAYAYRRCTTLEGDFLVAFATGPSADPLATAARLAAILLYLTVYPVVVFFTRLQLLAELGYAGDGGGGNGAESDTTATPFPDDDGGGNGAASDTTATPFPDDDDGGGASRKRHGSGSNRVTPTLGPVGPGVFGASHSSYSIPSSSRRAIRDDAVPSGGSFPGGATPPPAPLPPPAMAINTSPAPDETPPTAPAALFAGGDGADPASLGAMSPGGVSVVITHLPTPPYWLHLLLNLAIVAAAAVPTALHSSLDAVSAATGVFAVLWSIVLPVALHMRASGSRPALPALSPAAVVGHVAMLVFAAVVVVLTLLTSVGVVPSQVTLPPAVNDTATAAPASP